MNNSFYCLIYFFSRMDPLHMTEQKQGDQLEPTYSREYWVLPWGPAGSDER